jgi:hypothetical protein
MMSKIELMQPRSLSCILQARQMAQGPIDMPAKDEENLRDTSQGRTK